MLQEPVSLVIPASLFSSTGASSVTRLPFLFPPFKHCRCQHTVRSPSAPTTAFRVQPSSCQCMAQRDRTRDISMTA